jgi:hypothetical protein
MGIVKKIQERENHHSLGELKAIEKDESEKVLENIDEDTKENMGSDLERRDPEFAVNHFHGGYQLDPE